jgi:hypothetical protein
MVEVSLPKSDPSEWLEIFSRKEAQKFKKTRSAQEGIGGDQNDRTQSALATFFRLFAAGSADV